MQNNFKIIKLCSQMVSTANLLVIDVLLQILCANNPTMLHSEINPVHAINLPVLVRHDMCMGIST